MRLRLWITFLLTCLLVGELYAIGKLRHARAPAPPPPSPGSGGQTQGYRDLPDNDPTYPVCDCQDFAPDLAPLLQNPTPSNRAVMAGKNSSVARAAGTQLHMFVQAALPLGSASLKCIARFPPGNSNWNEEEWPKEFDLGLPGLDSKAKYSEDMWIAACARDPEKCMPESGAQDSNAIVTFRLLSKGKVELLDQTGLGSTYWMILCIIDADRDGLLDAICSSGPGVSGGGGVDILSISKDGKLGKTGRCPQNFFDSVHGQFSLADLDKDGRLDIEIPKWLTYDGARSHEYLTIYNFDSKKHKWAACTGRFPTVIARQHSFYESFLTAAREYRTVMHRIGNAGYDLSDNQRKLLDWQGQAYHGAGVSPGEVAHLLSDWDGFAEWQLGQH